MRKDRGINRWELVTCGLRGHVTYAPDEQALAQRLSGSTGLGEVWRCLRCAEFVLGKPDGHGPAADAPMIMRGKALRQVIIVRLLGAERFLRAVLIGLAAYTVWKFRGARGSIQATLDRDLPLLRASGFKVDQMTAVHEVGESTRRQAVHARAGDIGADRLRAGGADRGGRAVVAEALG